MASGRARFLGFRVCAKPTRWMPRDLRRGSLRHHVSRAQLRDACRRGVDDLPGNTERFSDIGGIWNLQSECDAEIAFGVNPRVVMHAHALHVIQPRVAEYIA